MKRGRRKAEPGVDMQLPATLIESLRAQRVVLFLGAGASMEAKDPGGQRPPSGEGLRDLLTQKFLGRLLPRHDLMGAAELCIDAHGPSVVFDFIRDTLSVFSPSEAHRRIPLFPWRAIATTNYDVLIERAYADTAQRTQNLVRLIKDREPIDERLRQVASPLLYMKLHGCLDNIQDGEVPPILAHEHYARYSKNRTRLFKRLEDMAHELPFVFIGYRLADPHIRNLIYQLEGGHQRPRWYIVAPDIEPEEVQSWANRNVEVIDAKFGAFMSALDRDVPPMWRALKFKSEVADLPIRRFYKTNKVESPALREAIDRDLTFVHGDIRHAEQDPKKFYEGFDTGWGCVVQRLDLRRKYVDDVVYQAFMEMPTDTALRLFVLRGPGGSGKTVALKRIAWEAATQLNDCPVLWFEQDGALLPEHVMELYGLTDKRVFVFVDRLALHTDRVMALLSTAKKQRVPVTVIGAERDSEWNVYCSALDRWNPIFTRVPNLSTQDVEGLIDLLERHRCLGLLTGRPRQEQIDAFMKTAERQLLVALHEATHGRKLEDIVFGEYNDVTPEQARRLYLDIATMHQFAVPVRAGTISRVSGVRFNDYEIKFLKPLENVVITGQDAHTGDHNYRARHSRIASLVFNQACPSDEEKADQLIRIIGGLDPGYSVDSHALLEITRGRNLSKTMIGAEPGRDVYRAASKTAPEMGFIDQQWAIFEANHSGGSLSEAEMLAKRARSKDRGSSSIIHTQAEIARRRANVEHSELLKEQFRRQARDRLSEMRPANSVLTASSRCKLLVDEVADLSETIDDTASAADLSFFADKVKEAEKALDRAIASYAGDPDIADTEARLLTVINEKRAATRALERAWSLNPRGAGVPMRLASVYAKGGDRKKAVDLLTAAIEKNPDDRILHLTIAKHLIQEDIEDIRIEPHLSSSYTRGDVAFEARHIHAQYLLLRGRGPEAVQLFDQIDVGAPPDFRQRAQSGQSSLVKLFPRMIGTVARIESTYIFLKSPSYPRDVFSHSDHTDPRIWDILTFGAEINFEPRFNRKGLLAFDIQLGREQGHKGSYVSKNLAMARN